jgi:hypothetical protein
LGNTAGSVSPRKCTAESRGGARRGRTAKDSAGAFERRAQPVLDEDVHEAAIGACCVLDPVAPTVSGGEDQAIVAHHNCHLDANSGGTLHLALDKVHRAERARHLGAIHCIPTIASASSALECNPQIPKLPLAVSTSIIGLMPRLQWPRHLDHPHRGAASQRWHPLHCYASRR